MLKKNEYNLMSTIFFYLNLSKRLHFFLFFKTKREGNNPLFGEGRLCKEWMS